MLCLFLSAGMAFWVFARGNEKPWASFHVTWLLSAHAAPAKKREMTRRRKEPHRDGEIYKTSSAYRVLQNAHPSL